VSKDSHSPSRYRIIVSAKVHKSAVQRNRTKRIIRAAFAELLPSLPQHVHYVVIVKKDCSMKKTGDMVKELEALQQ
jgi:ribonuclease P protein component